MKILLTGATGQVGRAIASHLSQAGHDVTGVSRHTPAVSVVRHIAAPLGLPDFVERVRSLQPLCDVVIHAAAFLSHDLFDPDVALVNCLGTQQVLELARQLGARQLIYISSVPVIGRPRVLPIAEDHPLEPLTAYHSSKLFGEHLFRLAASERCRSVSLRLTSPAGPGTPANRILGVFVRRALANQPLQLLGRGTRGQNYVDVRDVARAAAACIETTASGVYNIAGAEAISNVDLARKCIRQLSSASTVEFLEKADPEEGSVWDVSIAKARSALHFEPCCNIEQSIQAVADECHHSQ